MYAGTGNVYRVTAPIASSSSQNGTLSNASQLISAISRPTLDRENFSQTGRCLSVVSLAFLLESTTQIWSRTRLRAALGARPQSLFGSRVSLWHDRPEKFSVESRVTVAGYGARVPTQRLSFLRRYKLSHALETRRSSRQGPKRWMFGNTALCSATVSVSHSSKPRQSRSDLMRLMNI